MPTSNRPVNVTGPWPASVRSRAAAASRVLILSVLLALTSVFAPGAWAQDDEVAAETLVLVNLIRQRLSSCREDGRIGGQDLNGQRSESAGARTPLRWNPRLADVARQQAESMARQQYFSHLDAMGQSIGMRAAQGGYRWRLIGENLASGQRSVAAAMRGWLRSFTHCRNLIDERFTEVGLARVESPDPEDVYGTYWVLVLGRPAPSQRPATQPVLLAHHQQSITDALFAALN